MSTSKPIPSSTPSPTAKHRVLRNRSAFTLLEVILALAILAGAMAMLGELVTLSGRCASNAFAETRAQLLATSLMDEMIAGQTKLEQQSKEPLEVEDTVDWVYSVTFDRTEIDSLTSVEVLVEQDLEKKYRPVKYRLVRWLPSVPISEEKGEESAESSDTSDSSEGDNG